MSIFNKLERDEQNMLLGFAAASVASVLAVAWGAAYLVCHVTKDDEQKVDLHEEVVAQTEPSTNEMILQTPEN